MPPSGLRPEQGIVWLASFPRSGNTWLRTFVSNLLDLAAGRDPGGINLMVRGSIPEANAKAFREVMGGDPFSADMRQIAKARPRVQEMLAAMAPGPAFLKTHMAALKVEGEFAINWKASKGAVYVVRNPLDVVCSWAPHYGKSIDEAIEAVNKRGLTAWGRTQVPEMIGSWSQNVASWTSGNLPRQPLVVRYEDMLATPTDAFSRVVAYLGVDMAREGIERTVEASSFATLRLQEEEEGFIGRPEISTDTFFRKGTTGQWRETLSKAQVDAIVSAHAAQMERFGYLAEV
jgi:hypothetical protein